MLREPAKTESLGASPQEVQGGQDDQHEHHDPHDPDTTDGSEHVLLLPFGRIGAFPRRLTHKPPPPFFTLAFFQKSAMWSETTRDPLRWLFPQRWEGVGPSRQTERAARNLMIGQVGARPRRPGLGESATRRTVR